MQVEIKDKLYKDIVGYCEANNLDTVVFINDLLKRNFTVEKYGERPEIFEKVKPVVSSDEIIPIDRPMEAPDKTNLEEMKNQEKVVVVLEKQTPNAEEFKPVAEELIPMTIDEEPDLKEMVKAALANKTDESEEITLDSVKEVIKQTQVAEHQEEEQPKKKRRKLS